MKVRFWGTRGSIPRPGPRVLRYGGNTACVEVRSAAGTTIVIDCGTGAVDLGGTLCREGRAGRGALLISHTHWDHIQGLPFFSPFFVQGAEWDVFAPRGLSRSLQETLSGQMQHAYFPITLDEFAAKIRYHELVEGAFEYEDFRVSTHYLDHPALTLGYRLEADGGAVVYASDHESVGRQAVPGPRELGGSERSHVAFLRDADLVIHDAQYTVAEYPTKVGWGHSTPDYAAAVCVAAGARRLALTHHDPDRSDDEVDAIVEALRDGVRSRGETLEALGAAEGAVIELRPAAGAETPARPAPRATRPVEAALAPRQVVACGLRGKAEQVVSAAASAETLPLQRQPAFGKAVLDAVADGSSTVLIDAALAAEHAAEIARAQRLGAAAPGGAATLVVVGSHGAGDDISGVAAEQLIWPFSEHYARTRIRAAVLRAGCRWQTAPLPADETERLDDLRSLAILDTPRDERFDRIARLAARALRTPAALITLIDADRQWYKSCIGLDGSETTREAAFCAHAILQPEPLIVTDTFEDARFAENPAVTGGSRIRFYAGCPIRSPRGLPLGTLCVVDWQPRELASDQIELLCDLAALVEAELATGARPAE
jgi:phosphoribosyl 1,2-cyclic phosphodiesterase